MGNCDSCSKVIEDYYKHKLNKNDIAYLNYGNKIFDGIKRSDRRKFKINKEDFENEKYYDLCIKCHLFLTGKNKKCSIKDINKKCHIRSNIINYEGSSSDLNSIE